MEVTSVRRLAAVCPYIVTATYDMHTQISTLHRNFHVQAGFKMFNENRYLKCVLEDNGG